MKALAAILCLYWIALWVQPIVFPAHTKIVKVMSCCAKKHSKMHNGCNKENSKDDCCGGGKCNPLFSQCPICSPACVIETKFVFAQQFYSHTTERKYPAYRQYFTHPYLDGLLRPPQVV
jgi:hypothetical protein